MKLDERGIRTSDNFYSRIIQLQPLTKTPEASKSEIELFEVVIGYHLIKDDVIIIGNNTQWPCEYIVLVV